MNGKTVIFFVLTLTMPLYAETAEKKWIPIVPIKSDEPPKREGNTSKLPVGTKMIQNLKVIKELLDQVNKEGLNNDSPKNWYSLEPAND